MDADGLDIHPRLLAQFVALVDYGDVSCTAGHLRTTPRVLRRMVRELERAIGEPLVVNDDRSVSPTPTGKLLADAARRVLTAVERLEGLAGGEQPSLRVAHVANADTLAMVLDAVSAVRGWHQIEEQVAPEGQQLRDLLRHRLDVAICTIPDRLDDELDAELLRHDPLVVVPSDCRATPAAAVPNVGDLVAPTYGAAWPAHDEAVDAFQAATGCSLDRAPVPTGSGRELAALRRDARGRDILVATSALPPGEVSWSAAAVPHPYLAWHIVWRRGDDSPRLRNFIAGARELAQARHWLGPTAPAIAEVPRPDAGAMPRVDAI